MRETAQDVDNCEQCPWCLRRSCRGCDKDNPLRPLFDPDEPPLKEVKPLRTDEEGVRWLKEKRRRKDERAD